MAFLGEMDTRLKGSCGFYSLAWKGWLMLNAGKYACNRCVLDERTWASRVINVIKMYFVNFCEEFIISVMLEFNVFACNWSAWFSWLDSERSSTQAKAHYFRHDHCQFIQSCLTRPLRVYTLLSYATITSLYNFVLHELRVYTILSYTTIANLYNLVLHDHYEFLQSCLIKFML